MVGARRRGPDPPIARKETIDTLYQYLRHWAETWKFNAATAHAGGSSRRSADNFRSLLSVADVCGGDWPRRAREALVTLINETTDDQPQVLIVRHGRLLFERLETDGLEVGLFNRELHELSEPEFDWNRYRGPTGRPGPPADQHQRAGAPAGRAESPIASDVAARSGIFATTARDLQACVPANRF